VDGIVGPLTWASLVAKAPPAPLAGPPANGEPRAGFDTAFYPGDTAMRTWKESSPYSFVGYYLAAPVHPNASWMGKRATLSAMGWDIVVIYVGRQSAGPGSSTPPDTESGERHGADALAKTQSEGFPAGTVVYLDIEPLDHVPVNMIEYILAWLRQFAGSAYRTGLYCHVKNAVELQQRTAGAGVPPAFWVSGSKRTFQPGVSRPEESGIAFAAMWQGTFNQKKTFGGITINIDENVA
jgi:hypothetical protein